MPLLVSSGKIFDAAQNAEIRRIFRHLRSGVPARILLYGEAGLGKTTAARHTLAALPIPNILVLEGSASPVRAAFHPIAQALASITEQASKVERATKASVDLMSDALKISSDALKISSAFGVFAERVPQLAGLLRKSQPSVATEAADVEFQVQKLLAKISRGKNVVLLFRNLESYDASSISLLDTLLRNRGLSVSYIFTYDPLGAAGQDAADRAGVEEFKDSLLRTHRVIPIHFFPLTFEETRKFLQCILSEHTLTETHVQSIHSLTGGNPSFIVELLGYLQEEGELVLREGGFTLAPTVVFNHLPKNMVRLIDLRIERLQTELKDVIEVAAVIGVEFQAEPITYVLELSHLTTLRRLRELEKTHRLIIEEINARRFTYEGIRNRVYEHLGPSLAKHHHWLLAGFFIANPLPFDTDYRVHLQYMSAGRPADALPHLIRSAEQARTRGSHLEAGQRFLAAAAISQHVKADTDESMHLLLRAAGSLQDAGQFGGASELYDRLIKSGSDRRIHASAQLNLGLCQYLTDDSWRAVESLNVTLERYADLLSTEDRIDARLALASALYHIGSWDAARSQYRKCFRDQLIRTDHVLLGTVRKSINMFYLPELALPLLESSWKALKDQTTNPLFWEIQHNVACNYLLFGELDTAATLFLQCQAAFEEIGSYRSAYPTNNIGVIELLRGRYHEADIRFRAVREAPLSEFDRVSAECHLALTQVLRGNVQRGLAELIDLRQDPYVDTEPILRELVGHNVGWALYIAGNYREAEHHLRESVPSRPHLWRELKVSNAARLLRQVGARLETPALVAHEGLLSSSGRRDKWIFERYDFRVSEVWFWE